MKVTVALERMRSAGIEIANVCVVECTGKLKVYGELIAVTEITEEVGVLAAFHDKYGHLLCVEKGKVSFSLIKNRFAFFAIKSAAVEVQRVEEIRLHAFKK